MYFFSRSWRCHTFVFLIILRLFKWFSILDGFMALFENAFWLIRHIGDDWFVDFRFPIVCSILQCLFDFRHSLHVSKTFAWKSAIDIMVWYALKCKWKYNIHPLHIGWKYNTHRQKLQMNVNNRIRNKTVISIQVGL